MGIRAKPLGLAGVLALALVVLLSAPASATGSRTATGSVTCTTVTGSVKFSPPLTKSGKSNSELIKLRLKLAACITSNSNVAALRSGVLLATMNIPTTANDTANSCASLEAENVTTAGTGRWIATRKKGMAYPIPVTKSALSMSGEVWNTSGSQVSVVLPGSGTTSVEAGTSFPGGDSGASSTIAATLELTGAQFSAVCTGGTGHLSKSSVTGGSVTLG